MAYAQPAGTYNDAAAGNMPFGSQVVTINEIAYIANSINIKRPVTVITGKNEVSVPFRETEIVDVYTCDLELQLADVTTAAPVAGMPFTLNDVGSGNAPVPIKFKVQDVSPKFTSGGETMVSVTGRQRFAA